jgi:hypothetical protein
MAVMVIAFCAWSMSRYAAGEDPLALLAGSAQTPAASSVAATTTDAATAASGQAASAVVPDGAPATQTGAASSPAGAADVEPPASADAEEPARDQPASVPVAASEPPASVTASVTVDGSAAGAGSSSATVSLPSGATAYDALVAAGASVNARSTAYGIYVAGIGGLAEREHGGQSGWVYSVDGSEPGTACSGYVLSDGDSVVWTYVNVEY